MKRFIKRLATYVVTAYAQHLYKRIVKKAEERHDKEKTMIYVVSALNDVSRLLLLDDSTSAKHCSVGNASFYILSIHSAIE